MHCYSVDLRSSQFLFELIYRDVFRTELSSPMDTWHLHPGPRTFLCMIDTLSDPSAWPGSMESKKSSSLSAHLVQTLADSGLNSSLSLLVQTVCPILPRHAAGIIPSSVEYVSYHLMSLQCGLIGDTYPQSNWEQSPLQLLATSCLWQRCPSLKSIGGRLYRTYLTEEINHCLPEVVESLRHKEDVSMNVALALLGNIVQLGTGAISGDSTQNQDRASFCSTMACVLAGLVSRLPWAKLFSIEILDADNENEDKNLNESKNPSWDSDETGWDSSSATPYLVAAARGLLEENGQRLLEGLVHGVLVHKGSTTESKSQEVMRGATAVCELLHVVLKSGSSIQQQNFLLHLAISGGFVQRLWYSLLRGSTKLLEGNNTILDARSVRQELMTLHIFCQVYSCFLNLAGPEEVRTEQKPLPLSELYNPNGKTSGLIDLLKQYLWQVEVIFWLKNYNLM